MLRDVVKVFFIKGLSVNRFYYGIIVAIFYQIIEILVEASR